MARARQRSWRWPWERLPPDSEMGVERVSALGDESRWARFRASVSSRSEWLLKGSRFERIVPEKSTGSLSRQ